MSISANLPQVLIQSAVLNKEDTLNRTLQIGGIIQSFEGVNEGDQYSQDPILNYLRCRVAVAYTDDAARSLDFCAQRVNEYLNLLPAISETTTAAEFIECLQRDLGRASFKYLSDSTPVSPFSTVVLQGMLEEGQLRAMDTPSGIIIGDYPISARPQQQTLNIELKFEAQALEQLSLYSYIYFDIRSYLLDNPVPNYELPRFNIEAGTSQIQTRSCKGRRYSFGQATRQAPCVGMVEEVIDDALDIGILTTTSQPSTLMRGYSIGTIPRRHRFNFEKRRESVKLIPKTACFSELWLTRDTQDNINYVFAFDEVKFLEQQSLFPYVYRSPFFTDQVMNGTGLMEGESTSGITLCNMLRYYIEETAFEANSEIGTLLRNSGRDPSDSYPSKLLKSPNKINRLAFNQRSYGGFCFYEGKDFVKKQKETSAYGKYQYESRLHVQDSAAILVRNLLIRTSHLYKELGFLYNYIVNSPPLSDFEMVPNFQAGGRGLYDPRTHHIEVPLNEIFPPGRGQDMGEYLSSITDEFIQVGNELGLVGTVSLSQVVRDLVDSVTVNRNALALLDLCDLMYQLVAQLEDETQKVYPQNPYDKFNPNLKKLSIRTHGMFSEETPLYETHHTFRNKAEFGFNNQYGYSYLIGRDKDTQVSQNKITRISTSTYRGRIFDEFNKYFGNPDQDSISPFATVFENSSFAYFSPKVIHIPHKEDLVQTNYRDSLSNLCKYDIDKYGQAFSDIIRLHYENEYENFLFNEAYPDDRRDTPNNQLYSSLERSLEAQQSVRFSFGFDEVFETPRVITGPSEPTTKQKTSPSKSSFIFSYDTEEVIKLVTGGNPSMPGLDNIYFDSVKGNIWRTDIYPPNNLGKYEEKLKEQKLAERPIKLPFAILGELSIDAPLDLTQAYEDKVFNSLINMARNLGITENNLNSVMTEQLINFPNQMKSMFALAVSNQQGNFTLNNEGVASVGAIRPLLIDSDPGDPQELISRVDGGEQFPPYSHTKDPMKIYAKFLTFWLNYKQLAIIEYLSGFGETQDFRSQESSLSVKLPTWEPITPSVFRDFEGSNRELFCRVRFLSTQDILNLTQGLKVSSPLEYDSVDMLNLSTYNQYFLISGENPKEAQQSTAGTEEEQTSVATASVTTAVGSEEAQTASTGGIVGFDVTTGY
jgi:hypothetical protein